MKKAVVFALCLFAGRAAFAGGTITIGGRGSGSVTAGGVGNKSVTLKLEYQPPNGFLYTAASTYSLTGQWNPSLAPDATGYTLRLSTTSDFTGTVLTSVTVGVNALTAGIAGLAVNTTYYGAVKSSYSSQDSIWGLTTATATLSTVPLTANTTWTNVFNSSLTVNWLPGDNPASVTQYTCQISTVSGFGSGTPISSTTYATSSTFTGLTAGGTYYAQVRSINFSGTPSSYVSIGSTVTIAQAGAIVVQSSCTASSRVDPLTLTFNNPVTALNTIVGGFADTAESMATGDVTDNKGNPTYVMAPEDGVGNAGSRVGIFVSTQVPTGGSSFAVTINLAGTGATMSGCIAEVSGVTAMDTSNTGGATGTAVNAGALATSTPGIGFGIMSMSTGGTTTLTETGGATLIGKIEDNTGSQAFSMTYKVTTAGSYSPTWTAGGSIAWVANGAALK